MFRPRINASHSYKRNWTKWKSKRLLHQSRLTLSLNNNLQPPKSQQTWWTPQWLHPKSRNLRTQFPTWPFHSKTEFWKSCRTAVPSRAKVKCLNLNLTCLQCASVVNSRSTSKVASKRIKRRQRERKLIKYAATNSENPDKCLSLASQCLNKPSQLPSRCNPKRNHKPFSNSRPNRCTSSLRSRCNPPNRKFKLNNTIWKVYPMTSSRTFSTRSRACKLVRNVNWKSRPTVRDFTRTWCGTTRPVRNQCSPRCNSSSKPLSPSSIWQHLSSHSLTKSVSRPLSKIRLSWIRALVRRRTTSCRALAVSQVS